MNIDIENIAKSAIINLLSEQIKLQEVDIPGKQARVSKMLAGKVSERDIKRIIDIIFGADPTPEKKFVEWVTRQLVSKNIELPRDTERLHKVLDAFYRQKQIFSKADLNQYKNFKEVESELTNLSTKDNEIRKLFLATGKRGFSDKHILDQKVAQIFKIDPTKEKKYVNWITKQVLSGQITIPEDIQKWNQALTHYNENSHLYRHGNIDKYTADVLGEEYVKIAQKEDLGKFVFKDMEGADLVYDDELYKAIHLNSVPSVVYYSDNTYWCTKNESNAKYYLGQGHLVVFIKRNRKLALLNLATNSLNNVADVDLQSNNPEEFAEILKIIEEIYEI